MSAALRIIIWIGGLALLGATAVDTAAVIGRHVGFPIPGSIEMMQAIVLVSGIVAILVATIESSHARVKLVVSRLAPSRRLLADRLSDLLTLAFVAALLAGSSWIAWDLRHAHEQSELLGIPWMALRIIAGVVLVACCGVLAWRVILPTPLDREAGDPAAVHGE
ncbi:TRAP transporter small permease [Aurantiacibacter suaedae]|uniref:TRAP transporter small permease n=1 Tax=Aurantiacibacter suaedae TaxID=2545755 RepID=UPI0010FA2418|nr:TRAP transporter small permease subunit [Aurantiacibacter suaedae]